MSLLVGTLGACGGPVQLQGSVDQVSLINHNQARVVERLKAMDQFVADHNWNLDGSGWDVLSIGYELALVDGEPATATSSTNAMMGNPAAITLQEGGGSTAEGRGLGLSRYHPAGSDVDYLLLGETIRDLAPTPWISVESVLVDGRDFKDEFMQRDPYTTTFCVGSSRFILCGLRATLFKAISENNPDVFKNPEVTDLGMGMTLLSVTVPVWALGRSDDYPGFAALVPAIEENEARLLMQNEMIREPILIRLWQTAEGEPIKMEMNGELTDGERVLTFQSGWEKKGTATARDFPQAPSPMDVTHFTNEQFAELQKKINERDVELSENDE
jgi:hypothetical protein